jgi:predicted phage tail component-like protein
LSLSVKFNDIELDEILDVEIGFNPFEGADWERSLNSIPVTTGSTLVNSKVGVKTILMPFTMKGDINTKYDDLQRILNVSEPKKLAFGHMPNRYFLAVTTGKTDFKEVRKGFIGHGTITWLIPGGISHSTDIKQVTATMIDGILTANVNNNGSDEVFPTYRFSYPTENGYQAIAHSGGILELGNVEEVDQEFVKSEKMVDTTTFSELTRYTGLSPYSPTEFDLSGTLAVQTAGGADTKGLRLANRGTGAKVYAGGAMRYTVPVDVSGEVGAKNFWSYMQLLFWIGRVGQTGVTQIIYTDENDKIIAMYTIGKWTTSGSGARCKAQYMGADGNLATWFDEEFQANNEDTQNPFSIRQGSFDFAKQGDNLRFYFSGRYSGPYAPHLASVKCRKVYIVEADVFGRKGSDYITHNALKRFIFQKNNVDSWDDIPNRYAAGSELVVDTESGNIYFNGQPANDERVEGTYFYPLKPGTNKIEFYQSSWVTNPPNVTIEYKGRYL